MRPEPTTLDITKIDVRDGRVRVHLIERVTRAESMLSLTPANAEIYAREILDAVKTLDRQAIEAVIASLRRQAQQIETSLRKAQDQLARLDGVATVETGCDNGAPDAPQYVSLTGQFSGFPLRAGPPTPRPGLAVEMPVRVPIEVTA